MALKFSELGKIERILMAEAEGREAHAELDRMTAWLRGGDVDSDVSDILTRLAGIARTAFVSPEVL